MYNQMNGTSTNTISFRSLFSRTLYEYHTGIDTCTWLIEQEDRQLAFFENLEAAQRETGCTVWTTSEVIAEIQSKRDDPRLADTAARALNYLRRMQSENRIVIYHRASSQAAESRPFADPVFLARLLENRDISVALITQDRALACDVMQLNDFRSVRGRRIMVYRINGAGLPARFTLLKDEEGRYVDPRSTGLFVDSETPVSDADNTPVPRRNLCPGDTIWGERGTVHRLGEEISQGAESSIFAINGSPDLLVKIFSQPSQRKTDKCRTLREASFPCRGAVLPQELVYDMDGNFRGYTMKRVHGVELSRLFTQNGRTIHAPSWTRLEYVRLAHSLAKLVFNFSIGGLLIADISPSNFLVGYNASGILDPENIFALDLDSAQFGSSRLGRVFPPDGITPDYAAPEYLRGGIRDTDLRTQASVVYSAALLCLQCCMCGVHPFRKCMENGRITTVAQAISQGAYPYSSGSDLRQAVAPSGADKLWSNMSSDAKQFFHHLFQQGGQFNPVDKRPSMNALVRTTQNYLFWINKSENQLRYPEILSLEPTALKPYYAHCANRDCSHPQDEFMVTVYRKDGRYYCPDCLNKIRSARGIGQQTVSATAETPAVAAGSLPPVRPLPVRDIRPMAPVPTPQFAASAAQQSVSPQPGQSLSDRFSAGFRKMKTWLIG